MANTDRTAMVHRGNNDYLYDNDSDLFKEKGSRKGERERERERERESRMRKKEREITSELIRFESVRVTLRIAIKFPISGVTHSCSTRSCLHS